MLTPLQQKWGDESPSNEDAMRYAQALYISYKRCRYMQWFGLFVIIAPVFVLLLYRFNGGDSDAGRFYAIAFVMVGMAITVGFGIRARFLAHHLLRIQDN